jgi:hypothetical protein
MAAEQVPVADTLVTIFFKQYAGRGEVHRTIIAKKKRFADIVFQPLDGTGQAGGSNIAFLAGTAEV